MPADSNRHRAESANTDTRPARVRQAARQLIFTGRYHAIPLLLILALQVPGLQSLAAAEPTGTDDSDAAEPDEAKSRWGKLLPLPIFITEPAIGEGLGATLIYFHREDETDKPRVSTAREIGKTSQRSKPPPTATGIFGFYTNNDSAALGIGHSNSFDEDNWRLLAASAEARINSQLYLDDAPFDFRLEGNLLYAQLKRRLGDSNAFVGASLSYLDAKTRFFTGVPEIDDLDLLQSGFVDLGMALSLFYDTRDNTILPVDGYLAELAGWRHADGAGADFDYSETKLKGLYYLDIADTWVVGLRLEMAQASGDVPFYAAPYVKLRGIPALRYQGKAAGAVEIEVRRQFGDRWVGSVFTGSGKVNSGFTFGDTDDDIVSAGIGARYLVFPQQDAWVGLDLARGPEDTAWYIQMGSSW
jgi:hypothetical protein